MGKSLFLMQEKIPGLRFNQTKYRVIWQHYHQTFTLQKHRNWYYGGNGELLAESESFDYLEIIYNVSSKRSIGQTSLKPAYR